MINHPENNPQGMGTSITGKIPRLDKLDYGIALVLAVLALAAYVRTLAPDILYGDSAEFQCLAYTLGITHSTGYPTYLILGRVIGFLPVSNPAWRVNLLSALCAAIAVGGVYLLARYFTRSRIGAGLGGLALAISYTFWSQAVIAEVYTPGMAFIVLILLLLFRWQGEPGKNNLSLLVASLLAGIGFGVHASVWLIGLPAVAFVFWILWRQHASRMEWVRALYSGFAGAVVGAIIFLAAFLTTDWLNSPTSFIRTTIEPSRVFWNLRSEAFNSPLERMKMTVISAQWGDSLFPGGDFSFIKELKDFYNQLVKIEFSPMLLLLALAGLVVILIINPASGVLFPVLFLFSAFFILNYQVGDKYVFYLTLYIPLTVAAGVGMGFILDQVNHYMEAVPGRSFRFLYLLPVLFFITLVIQPSASARWQALRKGVANFVTEDYVFPVENLKEPRLLAEMRLTGIESNAVLVLGWRHLYTTAYIANVERGMKNMLFLESMPAGNDGRLASTLVEELGGYLLEGRPVYADAKYSGLTDDFRILPVFGSLYKITLRK
jgi:hypothetical protein